MTSLPDSSSGSSSSRGGRILCLCGDPLRPGSEIFPLPGLCGGRSPTVHTSSLTVPPLLSHHLLRPETPLRPRTVIFTVPEGWHPCVEALQAPSSSSNWLECHLQCSQIKGKERRFLNT
ncbi:hypothetical protein NDU88_000464 [Pleurodeles waltl]|uniref:Uncharacterized protein n=1 Tax=Pleurodeles waltl TaxID=8319 RepID=A0AAV7N9L1_PLEWA|nr:hypothetical protein NDU88_000464 [Pleurodeles waltl]